MSESVKLRQTVKGKPQYFFDDPDIDRLLSITLALASEVWVLRERLRAVEGLSSSKGVFSDAELEAFEFDANTVSQLQNERSEYLRRLFFVLEEDSEQA